MSEVRGKEIEIRARLMGELLQAQGVVLFYDFPRRGKLSSKPVAYLGKGKRMRRVLCLSYFTNTGLVPYPHAFIRFIWYGDDIMMGVAATRYVDGWGRVDSVLLEQYGVNRTYAKMFLEDVRKEKLACVRVRA